MGAGRSPKLHTARRASSAACTGVDTPRRLFISSLCIACMTSPHVPGSDAAQVSQASVSLQLSAKPSAVDGSAPGGTAAAPALPPATQQALVALAGLAPGLRWLMGLGIGALVIAGLYFGRDILIPLALAVLLGFLLDPAVTRLKRWGLPRIAAALVVVALVIGALTGMGIYLGSQIRGLSADLPTYQHTISQKLRHVRQFMQGPSVWDGAIKTYGTVEKEIAVATAPAQAVQKVEVVEAAGKPWAQALEWLGAISEPVATAGIVLLFVILILLDRDDLRDRLLRLVDSNLHIATDAMDEASERIGSYLRMQFIVNVTYGVPMAVGLWFIGVPGAVLWGVLATVMRFVPYVGPMISAIFPLVLAFAVAPGWDMLLWTLGLILTLELISNNVIEPWLYGSSTGLSTLSIILAATFWTALWGPIGLILSTPLTVCLLVLGRYLPGLHFLEVLLGSEPVLDLSQRLYQRLLTEDVEEALDLASESIGKALPSKPTPGDRASAVLAFYDEAGVPALRLASQHYAQSTSAGQRLRLSNGVDELLDELEQDYPVPAVPPLGRVGGRSRVHCIGVRWEMDALAARMAAHALGLSGYHASAQEHPLSSTSTADARDMEGWGDAQWLVLSVFHPQPQALVRLVLRRLRRQYPHARVVLALWNPPADMLSDNMRQRLGVEAVATGMQELVLRMQTLVDSAVPMHSSEPDAAALAQEAARVEALHHSGLLAPEQAERFHEVAQKAANAFDVRYAQVTLVDAYEVFTPGSLLTQGDGSAVQARADAVCSHVVEQGAPLVVEDIARDPRFADNPALAEAKVRFYAGVPLENAQGQTLGVLCLMDVAPRTLSEEELELLGEMAQGLMEEVEQAHSAGTRQPPEAPEAGAEGPQPPGV